MLKSKIKISCSNGEAVDVTKTYILSVKRQMVRDIKRKRRENPDTSKFYFYGLASFVISEDYTKPTLIIEYGDALSALGLDIRNKIYVEVPFRIPPVKKRIKK